MSVVGVGMRSQTGIASKMFAALAELSINIQLITIRDQSFSRLDERHMELAVRGFIAFQQGVSQRITSSVDFSRKIELNNVQVV